MGKQIEIIIVDDHALFREGISLVLSQTKGVNVTGQADSGEALLDMLNSKKPDIVLMDINMPGMDGIEATHRALEKQPGLKVIALSMLDEDTYYMQMIEAGAKGFVLKRAGKYELQQAIGYVSKGGSYFSNDILQKMSMKLLHPERGKQEQSQLSEREREVVECICRGQTTNEIAEALFLSPKTIEAHRSNIFSKLNVRNTAELIIWAVKKQIVIID